MYVCVERDSTNYWFCFMNLKLYDKREFFRHCICTTLVLDLMSTLCAISLAFEIKLKTNCHVRIELQMYPHIDAF